MSRSRTLGRGDKRGNVTLSLWPIPVIPVVLSLLLFRMCCYGNLVAWCGAFLPDFVSQSTLAAESRIRSPDSLIIYELNTQIHPPSSVCSAIRNRSFLYLICARARTAINSPKITRRGVKPHVLSRSRGKMIIAMATIRRGLEQTRDLATGKFREAESLKPRHVLGSKESKEEGEWEKEKSGLGNLGMENLEMENLRSKRRRGVQHDYTTEVAH